MASERRPLGADEIEGIEAFAKACASGTFYDILGVDPASSAEAINTAYHQIARQWHPDRFYSRDTGDYTAQIEDNFVAATRAFRTLRDAGKRAAYHRDVGIDVRNARPSSHPGAPPPILDQNLNATVQAGVTSPGGTPVYQTRLATAARATAVTTAAATAAPTAAPTAASASKAAPLAPRPKVAPTPLDKIRQQLTEQLGRAKNYYDAGKADYDAGRYAKAEGALYLALQFDPKNDTFRELHALASTRAREGKAKGFITLAEQEESYQRVKEAIGWYQKAVECDPPEGLPFFRLAMLLRTHEQDDRGAVAWLRKAVAKEPRNVAYRMALAELYESVNLAANALREATAALEADPANVTAKALVKRLKAR